MQIESILAANRTFANLNISSKKKALETIANIFSDSIESINSDDLLAQLIGRERLGTTGIGEGIAIPHCRVQTIDKTLAACITLESGIDFDAIDGRPVDLIFVMVVPENAETAHLETLAHLAQKFQSTNYAAELRAANDNQELYECAIRDN